MNAPKENNGQALIAIVDDDHSFCEALENLLKLIGFRYVEAIGSKMPLQPKEEIPFPPFGKLIEYSLRKAKKICGT